jgi:heat shock protein HslJ
MNPIRTLIAIAALGGAAIAHAQAPTSEQIANATLTDIGDGSTELSDGYWEGAPFEPGGAARPAVGLVKDFVLKGDLDGDGEEEAAVLLWSSSGGSGTFGYLAALERRGDGVSQLGITELGDRVQVRAGHIDGTRIVIDTVQAGSKDAACCPGQKFRRVFELSEGTLREVTTEDRGRVSSADLSGTTWVLAEFAPDAAVTRGVNVTLVVNGEKLSGSGGCNRYNAGIVDLEAPGSVRIGPVAGTRKACHGASMAVESRFLTALGRVNRFSFVAGKLALSWSRGDDYGTLTFRPDPRPR